MAAAKRSMGELSGTHVEDKLNRPGMGGGSGIAELGHVHGLDRAASVFTTSLWVAGTVTRSHRKTPVIGILTADTEKRDKQLAHRRLRARERQDLHRGGEENPRLREVSDPWEMYKDGKQRIDPSWDPRLMRK